MTTMMSVTGFVSTPEQLLALPAGTVALSHRNGATYRVVDRGPAGKCIAVQYSGGNTATITPSATMLPFSQALPVLWQPAA